MSEIFVSRLPPPPTLCVYTNMFMRVCVCFSISRLSFLHPSLPFFSFVLWVCSSCFVGQGNSHRVSKYFQNGEEKIFTGQYKKESISKQKNTFESCIIQWSSNLRHLQYIGIGPEQLAVPCSRRCLRCTQSTWTPVLLSTLWGSNPCAATQR